MGKLAPALTALGLAATLTACGSEAAPAPAPTPSIAASPTPSPTPTASATLAPPVMPEAAKAHTEAGAKAFVIYYWQVVDYSSATLETSLLEKLTGDGCDACHRGIDDLKNDAKHGITLVGGDDSVSDMKVAMLAHGKVDVAVVSLSLTNASQVERFPSGKTKRYPAGTVRERMTLQWLDSRWQAAALEAVE